MSRISHPNVATNGVADTMSVRDAVWQRCKSHSAHMVETVAALDNDFGVVGVTPQAKLVAMKVLNSTDTSNWSGMIRASNYRAAVDFPALGDEIDAAGPGDGYGGASGRS